MGKMFSDMKKGFTLVELLIVVVVIIALMTITFRLGGVASNTHYRNSTISRMQRLENCLSGYYAAFGSYPPVALHASRNVYLRVDSNGNQSEGETGNLEWKSVQAACRAQPIAARFPFQSSMKPYVDAVSKVVSTRANSTESRWKKYHERQSELGGGFTAIDNPNQVSGWNSKSNWQEVKIFQFGLMSFLLPRYLFMLKGVDNKSNLDSCRQWMANNQLSANPNNGSQFSSWENQLRYKSLTQRIPSQSVCARWMPNLEGIVSCSGYPKLFGVSISDGHGAISADNPSVEVFSSGSGRYVLDCMTVYDGWYNDFYYYSPAPYQSYRLWSGGSDGKTFPPWIPLDSLPNESDKKTAASWVADDIMFMSH